MAPSGFVDAAEMSRMLNGLLSEERLLELVASGYLPHWKMDGRVLLFRPGEVRKYVAENLLKHDAGRPFPTNLVVLSLATCIDNVAMPDELALVARHLRPVPVVIPMPGVYFLIKAGRVVYVGQSVQVGSRVLAHLGAKDFDAAVYLPVPESELSAVEGAFIRALNPPLNGNAPSGTQEQDRGVMAKLTAVCDHKL